jgi:DNA primase
MRSDLEEVKIRTDIIDVISEYVQLKKSGQNWKGLCPFHSEKTPSFTVSPTKQIYYCFGCSSGGDVFSFLMKYDNLSFQEALNILAKRAGVRLRKVRSSVSDGSVKETLINIHKDATLFYQKNLKNTSKASAYLEDRDIDTEARRLFSIGYAPNVWDALFSFLRDKKYKPETIQKAGLAVRGSRGFYDTFRNRIVFPIFDVRGEVIAFGGRVMDDSLPKYLNSPETPIFNKSGVLYGLSLAKDQIRKKGFVIFVEGYIDVIRAHMNGFSNTTAPLGTALTREHGQLIKRFAGDAVIVFDGDASGFKAAKNGIAVLLESGLNVRVLTMPGGEDPDSFLRKEGREAFAHLIENALSIVDFFITQRETGRFRKGDEHLIAGEILGAVSRIPDRSLQGYHVRQLSEKLNINEIFIMEQLIKIRGKARPGDMDVNGKKASSENRNREKPMYEIFMLQLILQFPEMAGKIFKTIPADDFRDPVLKSIFKKMESGLLSYEELMPGCSEDEKNFLTELMFGIEIENPEKVFEDCVKRLKSKKRQVLLDELQCKIKKAEMEKNDSLLRSLLQEKQKQLRSEG